MKCNQISVEDIRSPILPPDDLACLQRGASFRIKKTSIVEARDAYKLGVNNQGSGRKQRKYLFGSRYRDLFDGYYKVIDVREYGGSVDLNIKLENGDRTVLKVRDMNIEREFMKVVKEFSEKSNKVSEARCHSGDSGNMFAFGYYNSKHGDYKSMQDETMDIRNYSITARKILDKYFKREIQDIVEADRKQDVVPSELMGGEDGISAYALISVDLVNAAHFDLDTSVGISIFNEKCPGTATNWNFVLPNTTLVHGNQNKAVVIKLFDGCAIAWDGRKVFHCTSAKNIGEGNHVYGNLWGGKVYR